MHKIITAVIGVIAIAALALAISGPAKEIVGGSATNYDAITLDNGNLTISNGSIVVATPSTGTSTLATVGCLQANATSSATKIKVVFSTAGATSTFGGTAYWVYGTCP